MLLNGQGKRHTMSRCGHLGLALTSLALLLPSASAALYFPTASYYSVTAPGKWFAYNLTFDAGGPVTRTEYTAAIHVEGTSTFDSVCLDVNNGMKSGYFVQVSSSYGLTGLNPSWGNPINPSDAQKALNAAAYIAYMAPTAPGWSLATDKSKAASFQALQLAVWETLYDFPTTLNFSPVAKDRFHVNGSVPTLAQTLIGFAKHAPQMDFDVLVPVTKVTKKGAAHYGEYVTVDSQELMFDFSTIEIVPVPEAATILSGALLLLPFGVSSIRSLRQRRST